MDCYQLRHFIIRPTLQAMDANYATVAAENLLLGTAAQESNLGQYVKQLPNGPALGIYQMEPATFASHCQTWLARRLDNPENGTVKLLQGQCETFPVLHSKQLIYDLRFATIFARIHYLSVPEELPDADDIEGLGRYWKKYYNTPLGKGTVEEFVNSYRHYVTG